jgi:hypothetical protein
MLGVVLAFSLVQANNTLREFQGKVTKEAAAFQVLDRALLRIGGGSHPLSIGRARF